MTQRHGWPNADADERTVLIGFLNAQRDAVVAKAAGLSREAFVHQPLSSRTSIAGVVQHLSGVERYWFRRVLAGEDWAYPGWETDEDADWILSEAATVESVLAEYAAAIEESSAIIEARSLDDTAVNSSDGHGPVTLRWVLAHMLEETARHAGHLDILREQSDGSVGW